MNEDETLDPDSQEDINTVDQPSSDQHGSDQFVGPYKILRQMGQGGMGTVYLGTRTDQDFKRLFAIKVIRKGMDTEAIIERFRTERRILAALDHTNIARLIDGGTTTEGLPYFVMEYIEGLPLTKYCDSQRLTTQERLNIFLEICSAVQYAHRNLIVHRDLKPGNILVTSASVPKLLDFGIAKILKPEFFSAEFQPTATAFPVMTPHYASPEQSRGEAITTASDVYSLGVILYELLTGSRPYNFTGANYHEIQKVICEQEPKKPSTLIESGNDTNKISTLHGSTSEKLQKELQGDLDNIILMALRKEPNRRYSSVEAMMADLQNYLESRPVLARKSTWSYRAGKYVKRNTAPVIAASVVSVLLIAFAITLSIENARILQQRNEAIQAKQKAQKEEKKAEAERQKSLQVTDFLVKLFEVNDPAQSKGETLTARQILDRGAERLQKEFKDQPEVKAELMDKVGMIYKKLGMLDQAESLVRQSLTARRSILGSEHIALAESLRNLSEVLRDKGQLDEAETNVRQALAMDRKLMGNEHSDIAKDLNMLTVVLRDKGQLDEAETNARQALAMDRKLLGKENTRAAEVLSNLAGVLSDKGKLDEAEKLYRQALDMNRKLLGNEHPEVAVDLNNLALVLWDKGKLDEAESLFRQSLAMDRKLLGNEHFDVATGLNNLASVMLDKGQLDEAESLFRQALDMDRKLLGNEHPDVARGLNNLAVVLREKGKLDEAEKLQRQALDMGRKLLGREHPYVALYLNNLASVMLDKGQLDEAEKLYRQALDMHRKLLGNQHSEVAVDLSGLAEALLARGKNDDTIRLANEALGFPEDKLPADSKYRARAKSVLGAALVQQKKYSQAEPLLLDAYKILSVKARASKNVRTALQRIIQLYKQWGQPEKARPYQKLLQEWRRLFEDSSMASFA